MTQLALLLRGVRTRPWPIPRITPWYSITRVSLADAVHDHLADGRKYASGTVRLSSSSSSAAHDGVASSSSPLKSPGASISDQITATCGRNTLRYPPAPTKLHSDLTSYLAYAARGGVDRRSTTFAGTRYEYVVAQSLERLGFSLRRVGGRDDAGIDLLGVWHVPGGGRTSSGGDHDGRVGGGIDSGSDSATLQLRVILQCKASAAQQTRIGPAQIRELEGAFAGAPPGWRRRSSSSSSVSPARDRQQGYAHSNDDNDDYGESQSITGEASSAPVVPVVGLLVAQKPATKGVRDALGRSRWPMAFVSCSRDGRVEQMIWNRRAEDEGLEGIGATVQFLHEEEGQTVEEGGEEAAVIQEQGDGDGVEPAGPMARQLVLTWRGRPYDARQLLSSATNPSEPLEQA